MIWLGKRLVRLHSWQRGLYQPLRALDSKPLFLFQTLASLAYPLRLASPIYRGEDALKVVMTVKKAHASTRQRRGDAIRYSSRYTYGETAGYPALRWRALRGG